MVKFVGLHTTTLKINDDTKLELPLRSTHTFYNLVCIQCILYIVHTLKIW